MARLNKEICQFGISALQQVPVDWNLNRDSVYYRLIARMLDIKSLGDIFDKHGTGAADEVIEASSEHVVELDVSLNNLTSLDSQQLQHLSQLRVLNGSLNRIDRFGGVEKLHELRSLDLSHNQVSRLCLELSICRQLVSLNVAVNQIEEISSLPSLVNLRILNIDHNQLKSLNGLQALPALNELNAQHNLLTDVVAVSACLQLNVLNVADNHISSLVLVSQTLKSLRNLQNLTLYNNPIAKDPKYQSTLTRSTSILFLDNLPVRSSVEKLQTKATMVKGSLPSDIDSSFPKHHQMLMEMAKQAFHQQIVSKRKETDETVRQLQQQIQTLQESCKEFEERTICDMKACLMYLSKISENKSQEFTADDFREILTSPIPVKPWQKLTAESIDKLEPQHSVLPIEISPRLANLEPTDVSRTAKTEPTDLVSSSIAKPEDYRNVRETDEILRHAYNKLIAEQGKLNSQQ